MEEKTDAYAEIGALPSYKRVQRKKTAPGENPEKSVDNFDRGAFEVAKTKRWIAEHTAPVVLSAERKAEIAQRLREAKAKLLKGKTTP